MTNFQSHVVQITFAIMLLTLCAYGSGRAHQWYRHSLDRDSAFRDGYNRASLALFAMATRGGRNTQAEAVNRDLT